MMEKFLTRVFVLSAHISVDPQRDFQFKCIMQHTGVGRHTIRIPHSNLSPLQIAQLIDNLLDDRFELAHLDFEDREGFLVCDCTGRCQLLQLCRTVRTTAAARRTSTQRRGTQDVLVVDRFCTNVDIQVYRSGLLCRSGYIDSADCPSIQ